MEISGKCVEVSQTSAAWKSECSPRFSKRTCVVKLDGCHYIITANTPKHEKFRSTDGAHLDRAGELIRSRSLTTLENESEVRTCDESSGLNELKSVSSIGLDCNGYDDDSGSVGNLSSNLPPEDTAEALFASSHKLKEMLKKLMDDGCPKDELIRYLLYASKVTENAFLLRFKQSKEEDEDIDLGVVEKDKVPHEVREWLTVTFTRKSSAGSKDRRGPDSRVKFRSVANAIRAGLLVDRIHRLTSGPAEKDAPANVRSILKSLDEWNFDVFELGEAGDGHALKYLGLEVLHRYDLLNKFKIKHQSMVNFLLKLEAGYSKYNNPYHNLFHAADVTQTAHSLFSKTGLLTWMTDLEIFATLISTLIHDYEHTGTTNTFHINTNSDFALIYNDRSVLENYHASAAFRIMKEAETDILAGLNKEDYRSFRALVIDLVLSTDMSIHFQQVKTMKGMLTSPENINKTQVLSLLVHCADISHPAKCWKLHTRWTGLLLEEFFRQGDREAELGLPISPLCDRHNTLVAESQIGFMDFIVEPTFTVMSDAIDAITSFLQLQLNNNGGTGSDKILSAAVNASFKSSWTTSINNNKAQWKDTQEKGQNDRTTLSSSE